MAIFGTRQLLDHVTEYLAEVSHGAYPTDNAKKRGYTNIVIRRVEGGEDFAEIAGRFNDDPGGMERRGYLGWIHRNNPDLPTFFSRLFLAESGTLTTSILTPYGVVVLQKE